VEAGVIKYRVREREREEEEEEETVFSFLEPRTRRGDQGE